MRGSALLFAVGGRSSLGDLLRVLCQINYIPRLEAFQAQNYCRLGIVKLTDCMEISLITMPATLLILGLGYNRFRLENEQVLVNLIVPPGRHPSVSFDDA